MQLILHLPSGDFTINQRFSGQPFDWLVSAGELTLEMRTRVSQSLFGGTQNANVTVILSNLGNQVTKEINQPLRAQAELLNDDGSSYFIGIVQSIKLGKTMELTLEA